MYVHKGVILVNAFNTVETVKEGQFIAHDPYCFHSVESIAADTVVTTINISEEYIDENDGLISSNIHMVTDTKEYAHLKKDIYEWIILSSQPGITEEKIFLQMKKIIPNLQKHMNIASLNIKEDSVVVQESEKDHEKLTRILNYLFYHHDEPIKLDSISAELYLSKYYLSHYIKRTLGYTLKEVLSACRVGESVIDLLGSQLTIEEVAAKHGFPSVRSYNETFPRYYGMSPVDYRRRHQRETVLYKDLAGEEVDIADFISREEEDAVEAAEGCSVMVSLPKGSYEVLYVETDKNNASNRIAALNAKHRTISLDCDCDEMILRIRKQ
ncbi:MAG: helix-turn-helix transcriptional regulator [Firmicutes bacterium]|nr:helix-turn-helix transcriptional regulator [Bacillota bacterium]